MVLTSTNSQWKIRLYLDMHYFYPHVRGMHINDHRHHTNHALTLKIYISYQEYNNREEGRVLNSLYCCANVLWIIKYFRPHYINYNPHCCSWVAAVCTGVSPRGLYLHGQLLVRLQGDKCSVLGFTNVCGFNYPQRICTAV